MTEASRVGQADLREQFQARLESIERLIAEVDSGAAQELVRAVMELHGAGLARLLELLPASDAGAALAEQFANDETVAGLLLLHGLHPEGLETRVQRAIEKARQALRSHKARLELIALHEGALSVRLYANGCGPGPLKPIVEGAIYQLAPDIVSLTIEDAAAPPSEFVQIAGLRTAPQTARKSNTEVCGLCGREVPPEHLHLFEPPTRKLVCSCGACAALLPATRYKLVPRRVHYLPEFRLSDAHWNGLMLPINMAFFFKNSSLERVVAMYPSPAGATESLLALDAWEEIELENPILAEMEPDVEALLVNRIGTPEYFIVPIDQCFKLTGLIRTGWRGLSGGAEVWREIGDFFTALKSHA